MRFFCNVVLLVCLSLGGVFSGVSEASFCNEKTSVFFGNGMFTNERKANIYKNAVENRMITAGDLDKDQWEFDVSYNHNEGTFSLFEVFRQKMGDQVTTFWRWLGNLSISPSWFRDATQELAASVDRAETVLDSDLRKHVQRYKQLLMEGNRVLVVAHSQGNFYANSAYANLASDSRIPMNAFGIVAVGTPASQVAGGGPYVTLENDLVINAVRFLFPGTLPGTTENINPDTDWKHHNFIVSYLNGDQSGPQVISNALAEAASLEWPDPQLGKGPISVTLEWGDQPDLDLHAYEPNGAHVYYANKQGVSGYLDYDDQDSEGPEHYYVVDCESLETGRYEFGVNYYSGSDPEIARVQVQAGNIVRDYSLVLYEPRRYHGDDSPEPVAAVEVTGDEEQGYKFNVTGQNL